MTAKLAAAACLAVGAALALAPSPAHAQYHDYNTLQPSIEIFPDGAPPAPPLERLKLTPPPPPPAEDLSEEIAQEMENPPIASEETANAPPTPQRVLKPVFTKVDEEEEPVAEVEQAAPPTPPKRIVMPTPRPDIEEAPVVEEVVEHAPPPAVKEERVAEEEPQQPEPPVARVTDNAPAVPLPDDLILAFDGNASDIVPPLDAKLHAVARQLQDLTGTRLQVRAYATGEDGNTSSARRISLSRALSVRSFLMDLGIKPNRIDVRALGTETDRGPLDRVDMVFAR